MRLDEAEEGRSLPRDRGDAGLSMEHSKEMGRGKKEGKSGERKKSLLLQMLFFL